MKRGLSSLAAMAAIMGIGALANAAPSIAPSTPPRRRIQVNSFKQGSEIDAWNKAVDERNYQKRQDKMIRAMQRRRG